MLILGIDPGSRITGYGLVNKQKNLLQYVASGCIKTGDNPLSEKLLTIFNGVSQIIQQFNPDDFAIEEVFLAKNPNSALKLGQARGAAIVAAANHSLLVNEYSARKVKQAVVGNGNADKEQVSIMVRNILRLESAPQTDAGDALAIAICHANSASLLSAVGGNMRSRKGRLF